MTRPTAPSLGDHLRKRLRELRGERGWVQEDVARRAQALDLDWGRDTVANIENGIRALTLEEVLLLTRLFDVSFKELFPGNQLVALTPSLGVTMDSLRTAFKGRPELVPTKGERQGGAARQIDAAVRGVAEQKAADRFGVEPEAVVRASLKRWGRSLSDERDARLQDRLGGQNVPPRRLQALRGHVTRELLEELSPTLERARKSK